MGCISHLASWLLHWRCSHNHEGSETLVVLQVGGAHFCYELRDGIAIALEEALQHEANLFGEEVGTDLPLSRLIMQVQL